MVSLARSNQHFRQAVKRLPLGVSSNFRYWGEDKTIYVDHGKGGCIWDIDGNEYIDYRLAYGPIILGYGDSRVDEAARKGMEVGGVFALSTELEYEVASRISKMAPAAELVRFSNSGTEAVMAALRVARAYTGKDGHIAIEGGYHGLFTEVLWKSEVEDWDQQGDPELLPYGDGVPEVTKRLFHPVPLNDANAAEDLLKKHHQDIGAFLIEPIMGNCCSITADRQYLHDIRALCDRYDVLLIVDEVKTGFRVAKGGVQELFDFKADLCTFAKALGNGYPISVVAGREDIMRKIGEGVVHEGTFTAHSFTGHPALMGLFFAEQPPSNYREWKNSNYEFYDLLAPNLHEQGILVEPDSREPWFLCEAHNDNCLQETLDRFESAVDITIQKMSNTT
jgi:glutamate-1-semialdehyde 2,1-aminomutase